MTQVDGMYPAASIRRSESVGSAWYQLISAEPVVSYMRFQWSCRFMVPTPELYLRARSRQFFTRGLPAVALIWCTNSLVDARRLVRGRQTARLKTPWL